MAKLDDFFGNTNIMKGKKRRQWLEKKDEEETSEKKEHKEKNQERSGVFSTLKTKVSFEESGKDFYLRGNPLKIAKFLFENINKQTKISKRLLLQTIMENTNVKRDSAKTAIRFLCKQQLIERYDYKLGLKGGTKYKLSEKLYNDLLEKQKIN